jgi:hypothetical protein
VVRNIPGGFGTVTDRVWRSGTNCIYGSRIHLSGSGFEVNDLQRGGFRGRGPISIAYYFGAAADEVLFRARLTLTAVSHPVGGVDRPLTGTAPLNPNWVTFSTDLNTSDPDGSTKPDSAWLFVKSTCTTAAPATFNGAIRLRQTGQEGQPNLTISMPGYAPSGAIIPSNILNPT